MMLIALLCTCEPIDPLNADMCCEPDDPLNACMCCKPVDPLIIVTALLCEPVDVLHAHMMRTSHDVNVWCRSLLIAM